jgi:hypothetical protein
MAPPPLRPPRCGLGIILGLRSHGGHSSGAGTTTSLGQCQHPFAGAGSKAHTQAGPPSTAALPRPLAPWPVPHRPAPGRGRAVHRQMPRSPAPAGGHRQGTVAHRPRHADQARPPLVPVRAPLRVAPPLWTPHPHAAIRTQIRTDSTSYWDMTVLASCGPQRVPAVVR